MASSRTSTHTSLACEFCQSHHRSLFGSLTESELKNVDAGKTCTKYKKGQVLFHEGTRPLGVFCVSRGRIKVYRLGIDGKEQIIKISASGDLLGYKALLSDQHYNLSAEALDDCVVCFVPKEDFLELLKPGGKFYTDILKAVCEENGVMASKMTEMAQRSVRQRAALSLLMLKDTYGIEHELEGEIEINLTREDLANIVGTATESLIRLLNEFKKENLIETQGRKIRILDPKGLLLASKR
ncbi:Crp/Fnr family transcriptional regulator [Cryomorphaceae bacterium 1068]|nr:Crp/Fnr family transcriptional regulator [Cryomorphaceae bacterium 1068]